MTRYTRLAGGMAALVAGALVVVSAAALDGPSNLERIEQCAADIADSLISVADVRDSLCLTVVAHDAAWLIEHAIVERAALRGIAVRRCMPSDPDRIDVAIRTVGVVYRETDDAAIERSTSLEVSASIAMPMTEAGNGQLRALRIISTRIDTVHASDTSALAERGYPFTTGVAVAATTNGFWKKIIEPAVVLAASAIVVVLLFTVRSQ